MQPESTAQVEITRTTVMFQRLIIRMVITKIPNSVYTDAGGRITIDIVGALCVALSPLISVTWNIGCQYNNFNMPDN